MHEWWESLFGTLSFLAAALSAHLWFKASKINADVASLWVACAEAAPRAAHPSRRVATLRPQDEEAMPVRKDYQNGKRVLTPSLAPATSARASSSRA
jgi:hypothetical protein